MDDKRGQQVLPQELLGRDMDVTDTLRVNYWRFFRAVKLTGSCSPSLLTLKRKVSYFVRKMGSLGING